MNIDEVIKEYDSMFGVKAPREILSYLMQKIDMSREEKDIASEIILLNETIGFCRDATIVEEGVRYARELEHLMQELDFSGRIEYATTMLNLANAYRGFGMHADSENVMPSVKNCTAGCCRRMTFCLRVSITIAGFCTRR